MRNATIISCGAYAPENVITNNFFDKSLGVNVSTWLEENVHIFERRWASENESTADLAENAARQALERANLEPNEIDLIIVATDTPEYISPSTSAVIQDRLGAENAGTFDVNSACAGFVTALDIGSKYIISDKQYNHVLVIGAYAMSKYLNKEDKKTVTLFADGAGAFVLKSIDSKGKGFKGSELISRGEYNSWMGIYAGGTKTPISTKVIEMHKHQLQFVRKIPKKLNAEIWSAMIKRLCKKNEITPLDVDQYFITQININSIWETLDNLKVDRKLGHTIMHNYGYTGSACIPMAFNDAWEKGIVKKGDMVFFIGSGGGLAFASTAFQL